MGLLLLAATPWKCERDETVPIVGVCKEGDELVRGEDDDAAGNADARTKCDGDGDKDDDDEENDEEDEEDDEEEDEDENVDAKETSFSSGPPFVL
jgi:hypothetical protein